MVVVVWLILLGACSPRGELAYGPLPESRTLPIFIGSTRGASEPGDEGLGSRRFAGLKLARYDVAIPPDHRRGTLSVPTPHKAADPQSDFLVAQSQRYSTDAAFRAALRAQLAKTSGEAIVFTHGYNTNFAEGLFRFAQLGADFDLPGTLVHYSWPSQARVMGYAYDHDSALYARDGLADLLNEIRRAGAKLIILVGHSMGGFLTMEAMRQLATSGDRETLNRIGGVILISPDIDVDVFREEARQIGRLPQPFFVFASQKDKALRISAQIAGEETRLGNLTDLSRVSDLQVTLVNTAAFDTQGGHFNVGNSPALIEILRKSQGLARSLERDQSRHRDPFASAALTVRTATQIVLEPIEAIGDAIN